MSTTLHSFETEPLMQLSLAERVAQDLQQALATRQRASLAVSGGKTPIAFFQQLSKHPLDWQNITITLADERWVSPDSEDSNENLMRTHLLQGPAAAANVIGLYTGDTSPQAAEATVEARLAKLPQPLDVVVLGMGLDGHTLSWFPCADNFQDLITPKSHKLCLGVSPQSTSYPRMSMTLNQLRQARKVYLEIAGEAKYKVFCQAQQDNTPEKLPISAIIHDQDIHMETYWSQ